MKQTLTGILCGFLLICVLMGNALLMAYGQGLTTEVMAPVQQTQTSDVTLPVLMYHHILKDPSRTGDYVITPEQFENDLCYLRENGYTTVGLQDILNFYENRQPLPEKPILITFDDGYETFYAYAYPMLQKYQSKAAVMIIGKYTDLYSGDITKSLSYSHLNWEQLQEMKESELVEIGNHTYGLHSFEENGRKGIAKLEQENTEDYQNMLKEDLSSLNHEIVDTLGIVPNTFAYPFGYRCQESEPILQQLGFRILLTCEEKVNSLDNTGYQTGTPIVLNRFNRSGRYSTWEMFEKIES